MDIDFIIFSAFVLYTLYKVLFAPAKKPKGKLPQKRNVKRPVRPMPQGTQQPKSVPKRAKTLEQIMEEMYNQASGQSKPPVAIEPPSPPQVTQAPSRISPPKVAEKEVFSYDTLYEGEKYDKRKKKEIANILQTRKEGKHLTDTLHAYDVKTKGKKAKKKAKKKAGFKFNAKDAIIYDIIMNRKYK